MPCTDEEVFYMRKGGEKILQKLSLLIRRNRIYVAGAFLTAVLSNLSQMVYVYFIGELVNRIEARTSIGTPLFVIL